MVFRTKTFDATEEPEMFGMGIPELLILAVFAPLVIVPAAMICRRAGFNPWLGVFAAIPIANLALLAYLRYPVSLWGIGVGQCANRLLWLLRHGRRRGIWKGLTMIPAHLRANHHHRLPVSNKAVRSYLALRRAPVAVNL